MSVPPQIMQRMMQGAGGAGGAQPPQAGGAPGGMPQPQGGMGGPAAAPMARPQRKEGLVAAAQTNLHIAMNMLEEALPAFGSESKEGQEIMKALTTLGRLAGKGRDASDLVPAEISQLYRQMPQMGGGTDQMRMIQQMMQKQQQQPPQAAGV